MLKRLCYGKPARHTAGMQVSSVARRPIITVLCITFAAIGMYGIIPQFAQFNSSLTIIKTAHFGWIAAALGCTLTGYAVAALLYVTLAYTRLSYARTLLIELSGLLVNRVVPAGLGGLGLHYVYLRANRHTVLQAGAVTALNNLSGVLGNTLLIGGLLLVHPSSVTTYTSRLSWFNGQTVLLVSAVVLTVVLIGLVVVLTTGLRRRLVLLRKRLQRLTGFYRRRPGRLVAAVLLSSGVTLASVLSLWLCCRAVDVTVPIAVVLLIYSLGVVVGTAVPLPGGLGGTEAGLVAGLVIAHIPGGRALAAVLVYRLISFWLGLGIGLLASVAVRQQKLLKRAYA